MTESANRLDEIRRELIAAGMSSEHAALAVGKMSDYGMDAYQFGYSRGYQNGAEWRAKRGAMDSKKGADVSGVSLSAAIKKEISESLAIAEGEVASEKLGGNVVNENYWRGELAALTRMHHVVGSNEKIDLLPYCKQSAEGGVKHCCPNCGGTLVGDGCTMVVHCEWADTDLVMESEPDAVPIYCTPDAASDESRIIP